MQIETQFSIFLVNKPGVLAGVAGALARAKVNLVALALADSGEHGVLRIESDNLWLLFQRNVEILFDFGDVDGVINDSVSRNEPQFCREVKLQDIVVHFLGLLDVHLGQLFLSDQLRPNVAFLAMGFTPRPIFDVSASFLPHEHTLSGYG